MSNTNYVIMTVASVDFSYRETMAKLMSSYSKDLIAKAGAKGTRFGSIGTGEHAGSLLFVQFYDDLNGYQKGLEMQGNSSQFKEIMSSGKANIYLRNIATSLQTKFEQSSEHPKYIVITRAEAAMSDKDKLTTINEPIGWEQQLEIAYKKGVKAVLFIDEGVKSKSSKYGSYFTKEKRSVLINNAKFKVPFAFIDAADLKRTIGWSLKKITLCSKSKSLIFLKFSSDISVKSIPFISAPRAPDSNFISVFIKL